MNPDLEPLLEVPLQLEAVPPPHHLRPLPLDPHLLLSLRKLPLWMQSIVHCFESYISSSCKFLLYKVNIMFRTLSDLSLDIIFCIYSSHLYLPANPPLHWPLFSRIEPMLVTPFVLVN